MNSWYDRPPQFKHDCDQCVFLGRYTDSEVNEECDLYVCLGLKKGSQKTIASVIARLSDEPSDNRAGLGFKRASLQEAEKRAVAAGYVLPQWYLTDKANAYTSVGSSIWYFDPNRRKYPVGDPKRAHQPIWRCHWRKFVVGDQSKTHWLLYTSFDASKPLMKVNKFDLAAGKLKASFVLTEQEIDDMEWTAVHRGRMIDQLREMTDLETLRKVAAIIGYDPDMNV